MFAFSRIGMIIAKDGASMKWTNDVFSNANRQGTVFSAGLAKAASMIGEISANNTS